MKLLGLVIGLLLFMVPTLSQADAKYVNEQLIPATALLYSQNEEGGMAMRCTATAIEKNATGYVFVTASHCGCDDNAERKTVSPEKVDFYVTPDNKDEKVFTKATVIACGYKHRGDDFMLLQADTTQPFTVMALGSDPQVLDEVVNVASPQGLGKQVFIGSISSPSLNRPIIEGDINWEGTVTVQLFGTNGGSSGSALVCVNQKAICAFVVGTIGETTMIAMPVSRLEKMRAMIAAGTYKFYVSDPDTNATPAKAAQHPKS